MRILLVCLGNICRSPTAEAALRAALVGAGRHDVEVDSAGTGDWHLGEPPDPRMREAAGAVGLELTGRSRLVTPEDFRTADLILVMDYANLVEVRALAPDEASREKVRLFRSYEPGADSQEVPDPYYGGPEGFARVVEICQAAARGVVEALPA